MIFFPLAFLFVAGMTYVALNAGGEVETQSDADVLRNGYVLSGTDFAALTASPGTNFVAPDLDTGEPDYAVLSAQITKDKAQASIGVFATLGPQYEKVFAERDIEITVRARRGRTNPSDSFHVAYYTLDAGASEWQIFEPTDTFEDYAFRFRPGLPQDEAEIDYLGMWPAPEGESQTIEVQRITVEVVTP